MNISAFLTLLHFLIKAENGMSDHQSLRVLESLTQNSEQEIIFRFLLAARIDDYLNRSDQK